MTDAHDPSRRLTAGDKRFLLLCLLSIVVFGAVTALLFHRAFPEASIEFKAGRGEARRIGEAFLARRGIPVKGDLFAGSFDADEEQKVYLERTVGLERANRLYTDQVKLWRWQLRWFRPLRKAEVRLAVTPAGEVVGFRREIAEDAPGARLERDAARALAENFLTTDTPFRLDSLNFVEASAEERPARRDHSFVWEKKSWNVGESTLRVQVDVQGDSIGVFRQFVKVPEAWSRDYARLRSKNETAGVVATFLYVLTGIAALFFVIRFTRLSDVPWKTIGIFVAIGAVLSFLNQLNSIPLALSDYDTTQSFAAFIGNTVIGAFVVAVLVGLLIGLFGAAGEPLYRRRLPAQPALSRIFSGRGFRTKSAFKGICLGYALTAFFMAYQTVFYIVAAHFGAWAPADVPYSDLLNTYFPWIAILLTGFLPAVTEEFSSRMFSIPFYERLVRNPAFAVIAAGFVWGFLHAGYPNQPFYIRGIEVGTAGVVMGLVMLRYGIFPLLVWHFTVDALYSSMLLLRSGNLYFVISGAACAGILLVPLIISFVLYLRRKEFEPAADLANAAEGYVPEAATPEEEPEAGPPVPRRGVPGTLLVAAAVALAVAALFLSLPTRYPPRDLRYAMSRGDAAEVAKNFLRTSGSEPDSYKSVTLPDPGFDSYDAERDNLPPWQTDPVATRYVTEKKGLEAWDQLVRSRIPASLWTTRFVRPLVHDEWHVAVDPRSRRVVAFSHDIPESAPGADLEEEAARSLALGALWRPVADSAMAAWKPVAATSEKERNRRDWTFVFDDSAQVVDQAVPRATIRVQGNRVAGAGVTLRVPEDYVRHRTQTTALSTLLLIVRVATFGGLVGMIVAALVAYIRRERVPWRKFFRMALFIAIPVLLGQLNKIPALLKAYNSEMPWNLFLITGVVGLTLGAVVQILAVVAIFLVLEASRPGWRRELFMKSWPAQAAHAVVVALLALALGVLVDRLELLARIQWPHLFPGPTPPILPGYDTLVPFYDVAWSAVTASFLIAALIAGIDLVLEGILKPRGLRWAMALLVAISFGPDHANSAAEAVVPTFFEILALVTAVLVIVLAVRKNVLAYLIVLPLALGGQSALVLAQQPEPGARVQGILAFVVLCLPLLGALVASVPKPRPEPARS